MNVIPEFQKEYRFLSNFYISPFTYKGVHYNHVEAAFQAAKFSDLSRTAAVAALGEHTIKEYKLDKNDDQIIPHFFAKLTPSLAKKWGRKLPMNQSWDDTKASIVYDIVKAKFDQNPDIRQKLLDTKDAILIEGNHWHDNFWGACSCQKCLKHSSQNTLGKILMDLRKKYANQTPMTEADALLILNTRISRFDHADDINEALDVATQALTDIQEYRKFGTPKEVRAKMNS